MALDWISRLFSSGSAKGLSGDTDSGLLDPSSYYANRLRRHRTTGDVIEDPFLMWQTEGKRGLRAHLSAQKNQGSADFTDILVIVNSQDFGRGSNRANEPWIDACRRVLTQELKRFQAEVGFELLFATREPRFRVIQDGGPDMVGEDYGLEPGEFITGLIPNTYTGAASNSRPIIAIHLNIPDVWEGYREVGHLYSDQVVFTLGNHWLDSFSHFALQEPALYRLQQYLDGSFVHIIDPDLQQRYSVTSDDAAGANVLSIVDVDGEPVCHLVLALMDSVVSEGPPKAQPTPPPTPTGDSGGGHMPQIDLPPARPLSGGDSLMGLGHKTIVPESVQERIFTLRERGALLQKVHFRKFMQGYDVYVSPTGNLSTNCVDRAATFQVRNDTVALVVHKPDVLVNGRTVSVEVAHPLTDHTTLKVGPHTLEYNDLSTQRSEPGWPYLGEILRPPISTHLVFGGKYRIGRDRRCKIQLPDEPQNDNIAWLPSTASGATIRARSGEIPKSRFYTDSIMVASEHAEIDLTEDPQLSCIARHCYAYVRRNGSVNSLFPTKQSGERHAALKPGDDLLIGNCLFQVQYAPEDIEAVSPTPPPPPKLTAADLAGAIDTGTTDVTPLPRPEAQPPAAPEPLAEPRDHGKRSASLIDQILNAPRPSSSSSTGSNERRYSIDALLEARSEPKEPDSTDVPSAAGLGDSGDKPRTYDPEPVGFDSLMDSTPPVDDFGDPGILPSPDTEAMADPDTGEMYRLPGPTDRKQVDKTPFDVFGGPIKEEAPSQPVPSQPAPSQPPTSSPPESAGSRRSDAGNTWSATDSVVRIIDDENVQFELARPARLVHIGWALSGDALVGNYLGCSVIVPETRYDDDQEFPPRDYFKLKVRGKRGKAELVNADEASMQKDGEGIVNVKGLDGVGFEIIRRDEDGDEDFRVHLQLDPDFKVPDPRGRLLRVDTEDPIVMGLFATGLPLSSNHPVQLGPIHGTARYDAGKVILSDYIDSYRRSDGRYQPFFVSRDDSPFGTAPEDGRPVELNPGDHLIAGTCVYRVDER